MSVRNGDAGAKVPKRGRPPTIAREAVVEVAAVLFLQQGYERTTLTQIADKLGISAPSLYWHFQSKEEVLYEFLRTEWLDHFAAIETATATGGPTDRLQSLAAAHVRRALKRPSESRAFLSHFHSAQLVHILNEEHRAELEEFNRRYVHFTQDILYDGVRSGEFVVPSVVAASFAIMNACEYVVGWFHDEGSLSIDDVAELHGEYALRIAGVDLALRPAVARFVEGPRTAQAKPRSAKMNDRKAAHLKGGPGLMTV
jgi:TetR/AcrR family transcriptional regulator, cholesterol catabolism regulator